MKYILITGGLGYIGSHLAVHLLNQKMKPKPSMCTMKYSAGATERMTSKVAKTFVKR